MTFKELIKKLQEALAAKGESLTIDGDPGPKTLSILSRYDVQIVATRLSDPVAPPAGARVENPAYVEAKKYEGKTETDPAFVSFLEKYWPKAGLKGWRGLAGSARAWCALFVLAMGANVGQRYVGSAAAIDQRKSGVEIEWRTNGIPKGALVGINHDGNCKSGSGNHITFADADCSAADLAKAGATFPGFGGNQGNAVKTSIYSVKEICAVRWPAEVPLPPPITVSVGCKQSKTSGDSTR